jgi:hypothetical protein
MSASKLPVVVELEDGYAVTFDDCVIAWRRDGDRYVVSISAVHGEDFQCNISAALRPKSATSPRPNPGWSRAGRGSSTALV